VEKEASVTEFSPIKVGLIDVHRGICGMVGGGPIDLLVRRIQQFWRALDTPGQIRLSKGKKEDAADQENEEIQYEYVTALR